MDIFNTVFSLFVAILGIIVTIYLFKISEKTGKSILKISQEIKKISKKVDIKIHEQFSLMIDALIYQNISKQLSNEEHHAIKGKILNILKISYSRIKPEILKDIELELKKYQSKLQRTTTEIANKIIDDLDEILPLFPEDLENINSYIKK